MKNIYDVTKDNRKIHCEQDIAYTTVKRYDGTYSSSKIVTKNTWTVYETIQNYQTPIYYAKNYKDAKNFITTICK